MLSLWETSKMTEEQLQNIEWRAGRAVCSKCESGRTIMIEQAKQVIVEDVPMLISEVRKLTNQVIELKNQ
jgi:hypothetical protein